MAGGGLWLRRQRHSLAPVEAEPSMPHITPATSPPAGDRHVAVLVWAVDDEGEDQIELTGSDVTLGREPEAVDIVVDEPSVSRLHARIRRNAAGEHWLYDEGSIEGTYLNYERLGLAPRLLQHNDVVQLGQVLLRFKLQLPQATHDGQQSPDEESESGG